MTGISKDPTERGGYYLLHLRYHIGLRSKGKSTFLPFGLKPDQPAPDREILQALFNECEKWGFLFCLFYMKSSSDFGCCFIIIFINSLIIRAAYPNEACNESWSLLQGKKQRNTPDRSQSIADQKPKYCSFSFSAFS